MTHVTYHDCLEHIITGKPLSCNCERCRERLESVRREQTFPKRITEHLPHSFWSEHTLVTTKRAAWWMRPMPILAAALLLLTVGLILVSGQRRHKPVTSVIASMEESEQERLYMEVEDLLNQPPLGDMDLLAEEEPSVDTHTFNRKRGVKRDVTIPVHLAALPHVSFGSSDLNPSLLAGRQSIKGVSHEA